MIAALNLQQVRELTGGELQGGNPHFNAVSTDTRSLHPGQLFIALTGPNFDGNGFIADAAAAGACAALVSRPQQQDAPLPTLQVADTRIALGQLGAHNRRCSTARVVALTGSQGKTSVKEMTAAILAQCGPVLSTHGNLNNDLGVPLTLLQIDAEHHFAVIELGANAGGEIAYTAALTQPDVAHITNVAPTHLQGFGSLQGVAAGKAELWQGLVPGGTAVLNLDDELVVAGFSAGAAVRRIGISASGKAEADYALDHYDDAGIAGGTCQLRTPQGQVSIQLVLPGRHNAANALAATALAMEAGADLQQVVAGLSTMRPVKGRMQVRRGRRGASVIDDSYNASPASFHAALLVLARQPGLRIVVAGDMGELGNAAEAQHAAIGHLARELGIERFIGVGPLSRFAVEEFGATGQHVADRAAAVTLVEPLLDIGVCILVKGSRSASMEHVVDKLVEQED